MSAQALWSDSLSFVSTGLCPGCAECADNLGVSLQELQQEWEDGADDEGAFSWSPCFNCGSTLGGTRYVAHGRDENDDLEHFRVCQDCFDAINGLDEEGEWEAADIVLADDGTLDTVFRCRNCGGEERYTFAAGGDEETYEEFCEWAFEDARERHECQEGKP